MGRGRKQRGPEQLKMLVGKNEIDLKTPTEQLLCAVLKAVLYEHGDDPTLNDAWKEFYMDRFAFVDSKNRRRGKVQIAQDGNNGRDIVRLIKE